MRKVLLLFTFVSLFFLCNEAAKAQGFIVHDVAYQTIFVPGYGNLIRPIPGATITVCQGTYTGGTPCNLAANTYTSTALTTQSSSNVYTADNNGNYSFIVDPKQYNGQYIVSITGVGVPGYLVSYSTGCPGGQLCVVAEYNATATGNISSATLYSITASSIGLYRVSCYTVITIAATSSSTLPTCSVGWTDADSGASESLNLTTEPTTNVAGTLGTSATQTGTASLGPKLTSNITYATSGYASSGATSMQYAVHLRLEYLGP